MKKPEKKIRRPRQERSKATVDAILTAATKLLDRDGIEALTTNKIAEIAGVGIASLYQYFGDKSQVLQAIGQMFVNQKLELVKSRLEQSKSASLEDSIRDVIRALIEIKSKNSKLERILETQIPLKYGLKMMDGFDAEVIALFREFLEPYRDELKTKDIDTSLFIVTQAVKGVLVMANFNRPEYFKSKDLERILTTMAIAGLKDQ